MEIRKPVIISPKLSYLLLKTAMLVRISAVGNDGAAATLCFKSHNEIRSTRIFLVKSLRSARNEISEDI